MKKVKRKVFFRADGNQLIGMGHFTRALALAEIIKHEFDCVFATINPTKYQENEINKHCGRLINLPEKTTHIEDFLSQLNGDEIVVIDNYDFSTDFQLRIKSKGCKVVYIDDFNDKHYVCDALINNIPGIDPESFIRENYTKLYLGIDYALLRKEFLKKEWRSISKVNNLIFLSFGGSDIHNLTLKFIKLLRKIDERLIINVLIGDAFQHLSLIKSIPGVNIFQNIPAKSVAGLIAKAEICVVPASSLLNEVSCIGSKTLVGYFTNNQLAPYRYFVEENLAIGAGNFMHLEYLRFRELFFKVRESELLIKNLFQKYRFQQEENLKKVFFSL